MKNYKDITGQRFNQLVAIRRYEQPFILKDGSKKTLWVFQCDCGTIKPIHANNVITGKTRSCGCAKVGYERVNLSGQRFGKVTVLRREGKQYVCKCDCGKEFFRSQQQIRVGKLKSCGCIKNLPDGMPSRNHLFAIMKQGAQRRNYAWELTIEQFASITKKDCFYCGASPRIKSVTRDDVVGYIYNGIDRVDNSLGYIEGNVVPCCKFCNIAKNTYSIDEFKEWAIRLYNHWAGLEGKVAVSLSGLYSDGIPEIS